MNDDGMREGLLQSDAESVSRTENGRFKPKPYSRRFTIIFAILAITLTVFRGLPFLTQDRLALLYYPETTVLWVVEQNLYLHDASAERSFANSLAFALFGFSRDDLVFWSEKLIRDVTAHLEKNPLNPSRAVQKLRANLIIILCEAGRLTDARAEIQKLEGDSDVHHFKQAVEAVYFGNLLLGKRTPDTPVRILENGWASSHLQARIALLDQNEAEISRTKWWLQDQGQHWMNGLMLLCLVILCLLVAGIFLFVKIFIPKRDSKVVPEDHDIAPWAAGEGYGIIARGVCYGTSLYFLFPMFGENLRLLYLWPALIIWGPTALLFYFRISRPRSRQLTDFLGLNVFKERTGIVIGAGIPLCAAAYLGGVAIFKALSLVGMEASWAEGIDEYLMYETWPWRLAVGIEAVIWAPIFEEVLFRGLLFTALRKQIAWPWAALVSGVCFGAVHFYSVSGFLSVTLVGFLMAFGYEKTKSLVPCIVAHALFNLIHTWTAIWSTSSAY